MGREIPSNIATAQALESADIYREQCEHLEEILEAYRNRYLWQKERQGALETLCRDLWNFATNFPQHTIDGNELESRLKVLGVIKDE